MARIKLTRGQFLVTLPSGPEPGRGPDQVRALLHRWYLDRARAGVRSGWNLYAYPSDQVLGNIGFQRPKSPPQPRARAAVARSWPRGDRSIPRVPVISLA